MITTDEGLRGGKKIPLKSTVDKALEQCPDVKNVFVAQRTGADVPMVDGRDQFLEKVNCAANLSVVYILIS